MTTEAQAAPLPSLTHSDLEPIMSDLVALLAAGSSARVSIMGSESCGQQSVDMSGHQAVLESDDPSVPRDLGATEDMRVAAQDEAIVVHGNPELTWPTPSTDNREPRDDAAELVGCAGAINKDEQPSPGVPIGRLVALLIDARESPSKPRLQTVT